MVRDDLNNTAALKVNLTFNFHLQHYKQRILRQLLDQENFKHTLVDLTVNKRLLFHFLSLEKYK